MHPQDKEWMILENKNGTAPVDIWRPVVHCSARRRRLMSARSLTQTGAFQNTVQKLLWEGKQFEIQT